MSGNSCLHGVTLVCVSLVYEIRHQITGTEHYLPVCVLKMQIQKLIVGGLHEKNTEDIKFNLQVSFIISYMLYKFQNYIIINFKVKWITLNL